MIKIWAKIDEIDSKYRIKKNLKIKILLFEKVIKWLTPRMIIEEKREKA